MKPDIGVEVLGNILAEAGRRRITNKELSNGMHMSRNTWCRRMENPGDLKLDEVKWAAELFRMNVLDLLIR